MSEIDRYVREVLQFIHATPSQRARIEADLRAHLAEAVASGESPEAAIRRLGTPQQVAGEFMASVPLHYAGFGVRLGAFLIDLALILALSASALVSAALLANFVPREPQGGGYLVGAIFILAALALALAVPALFILYFPIMEGRFGQTLGKRLLHLWVLKENGLPIGFREAFLRRLPFYFEFAPIDALFIPFTQKRQRAFDIVARTIVAKY